MLNIDQHVHTNASPDGRAPIEAIVASAKAKGLIHLALTDHYESMPADPQFFVHDNNKGWFAAAQDRYHTVMRDAWENGERAKQLAGEDLTVVIGIELGSPLDDLPRTEEILAAHDYGFILASQHNNTARPDFYYLQHFPELDLLVELDRYFDALYEIVQWGKFHSLAHLTYPFRYIPSDRMPPHTRRWDEQIDAILRLLAEKGLALEVNTAGLRKGLGVTSPDLTIVRRFKQLGGELITIGSDAHLAEDVGADLEQGAALCREAGFRYVARYVDGKPILTAI